MFIKNRIFFSFLFTIGMFFLNQEQLILKSKENNNRFQDKKSIIKTQKSNNKTKIQIKQNQNFSKTANNKKIVIKTIGKSENAKNSHYKKITKRATSLHSQYDKNSSNSSEIKSFYLDGKKLFYKNEYSPFSYKLNNFCFLAIDEKTGHVLFAKNPNEKCYPASLTKLMTLYILFENLQKKNIKMDSRIYFSKSACGKQKKNLDLMPGDSISVFEAIQAMIVISANDVAAAFAEKISGSEEDFGELMSLKAQELGMKATKFGNASGLFNPIQQTTPIDLLRLSIAIKKDFPQYYHFFSQTNFVFRGRLLSTHNRVTKNYPGASGFKTGFINASGFNIVSSAARNGKEVLAVVMGADTVPQRDAYMMNLLDQSFLKLNSLGFLKKNKYNEYFKNHKSSKNFENNFVENYNNSEFSDNSKLVSFKQIQKKRSISS